MVYRIFVEKKPGLDNEARAIKNDINELLQIKGVLPAADEDSPMYVVCQGTAYEAFCLGETGFGLSVAGGCKPEYVVCKSDGVLVAYEIEITD